MECWHQCRTVAAPEVKQPVWPHLLVQASESRVHLSIQGCVSAATDKSPERCGLLVDRSAGRAGEELGQGGSQQAIAVGSRPPRRREISLDEGTQRVDHSIGHETSMRERAPRAIGGRSSDYVVAENARVQVAIIEYYSHHFGESDRLTRSAGGRLAGFLRTQEMLPRRLATLTYFPRELLISHENGRW